MANIVVEATGAAITSAAAECAGGVTAGVVDAVGPLGYLAEGVRTNLLLQSNAFTTTWGAYSADLTPVQNVTGPDGATSAWTFTDATAAGVAGKTQVVTVAATPNTFSIAVKKTTGAQSSYPIIGAYRSAITQTALATIDTSNGVATVWTAFTGYTVVTSSARIRSLNADYWLVELTLTPTAEAWTLYIAPAATANATQSTGALDATAQGSAVFYGAQLEAASFASTYAPTTTLAVQRNGDIDQYVSASNISATATSITLQATPTQTFGTFTGFLWGTFVDASNYTALLFDGTNLIARKRIGGANHDATIAWTPTKNTTAKVGARFDTSHGIDVWLNGAKGTPDTTTTASQIGTNFQVGADGNSLQQPFSMVRLNVAYPSSLSDSRMGALTT